MTSIIASESSIECIVLDDSSDGEADDPQPTRKMARIEARDHSGSGLTSNSIPSPHLTSVQTNHSKLSTNESAIQTQVLFKSLTTTTVQSSYTPLQSFENTVKINGNCDHFGQNGINGCKGKPKDVLIKQLIGFCAQKVIEKQLKAFESESNLLSKVSSLKTESIERNHKMSKYLRNKVKTYNKETQTCSQRVDSIEDLKAIQAIHSIHTIPTISCKTVHNFH